jgi:hypothetical protein
MTAPHPATTRRKAEQNTSTPSNPRPADALAFTAMFASEMDS